MSLVWLVVVLGLTLFLVLGRCGLVTILMLTACSAPATTISVEPARSTFSLAANAPADSQNPNDPGLATDSSLGLAGAGAVGELVAQVVPVVGGHVVEAEPSGLQVPD